MENASRSTTAAIETVQDRCPLRFAVLCKGMVLQEWQARSVRALVKRGGACLSLVIVEQSSPSSAEGNSNAAQGSQLFRIFRGLFVHPRALRPVDMTELLAAIPAVSLPCDADRLDGSEQLAAIEEARRNMERGLDFILHFGSRPVPEALLEAARYGVWAFHHGDGETYRDGPPAFWEILDGAPVTGAVLRRLSFRPDQWTVLRKGFFQTIDYSYAGNVDAVFLESASWPAEVCDGIRRGAISDPPAPPIETTAPLRGLPDSRETIQFVQTLAGNIARRAIRRLVRRVEWNIGIVDEPVETFLQPGSHPTVHWLPALSKHRFAADPFAIEKDGQTHLFFEEYDRKLAKGVISHVALCGETVASPVRRVLDLPVHLSYPYVFECDGNIYCLPETSGAREIVLFQAVSFPYRWRKAAVLVEDIAAADATVFEFDGRWWLLCTDVDTGENLRLVIWHAPDLFGPWQPHAGNPVKTDIRSSRPAGRPFIRDGVLFRPAQDCSRTYGGGITLNRVTRLTPEEFAEEPVTAIQPDPAGKYPEGIHTLSACGDVTFVDGKRLVVRSPSPARHAVERAAAALLRRQPFTIRPRMLALHERG